MLKRKHTFRLSELFSFGHYYLQLWVITEETIIKFNIVLPKYFSGHGAFKRVTVGHCTQLLFQINGK